MNRVVTYAKSHNVENLTLEIGFNFQSNYSLDPCIFSCKSLTRLKIVITTFFSKTKLPTSLHFPKLKSLHLMYVTFVANANGIADPFSNCSMLTTLVLDHCFLHHNAKVLCISNSKLSSLTIGCSIPKESYKIVVSCPNLNSISLMRDSIHQVSVSDLSFLERANIDVCDLSFLEEENIDDEQYRRFELTYSSIICWLHALANYVKILILSSTTLKVNSCILYPSLFA